MLATARLPTPISPHQAAAVGAGIVPGPAVTDRLLAIHVADYPLGSEARGRFLLAAIQAGYPTPRSRAAYFENLILLLRTRPARARLGTLVIGMGTGRSGSTTLCHILSTCPDSCATHENPPLLHWQPTDDQVAFHLERFGLMRRHFALVADTAHWWLNAIGPLTQAFPDVRFIGTWRETAACAESFLRLKGEGPGSLNHWLPEGAPGVLQTTWDPAYPTFDAADPAAVQRGDGKRQLIRRYIEDYNRRLRQVMAADPGRWLLLRTEELNERGVRQALFAHTGTRGIETPVCLNARGISDGETAYRF